MAQVHYALASNLSLRSRWALTPPALRPGERQCLSSQVSRLLVDSYGQRLYNLWQKLCCPKQGTVCTSSAFLVLQVRRRTIILAFLARLRWDSTIRTVEHPGRKVKIRLVRKGTTILATSSPLVRVESIWEALHCGEAPSVSCFGEVQSEMYSM